MPQRSTPFQAIVRLVREHFAQPGVTITESKYLPDVQTGEYSPEVDIVVEGELDGEPMLISIEVNERGRKAGPEWVHQMLRKHQYLPDNKLILVSKAGFTRQALAIVAKEPRVDALTPEIVSDEHGNPVVQRLYADKIEFPPKSAQILAATSEQQAEWLDCEAGGHIFGPDGELLGYAVDLIKAIFSREDVRDGLAEVAHNHPERDRVSATTISFVIYRCGFSVRPRATGDLAQILMLKVETDFSFEQTEVPLTLARLGRNTYASAQVPLDGRPAVMVATVDSAQGPFVSIRWTDRPAAVVSEPGPFHSVRDIPFGELTGKDPIA